MAPASRSRNYITHQDDMTKVDLPSFVKTTTSDITKWRYDVSAHVSAVTVDCLIFSHELGAGSKTASSIAELILSDHLLRCRGERIKVVVSDNAAVGKKWLTTIALPQYMVDQGLVDIVLIVYLGNNHGKWFADMLFGQLQIRRKRWTIVSIDVPLSEFEEINRKNGIVRGFAVNPLASVDFQEVFRSLGYQTKPPKDFLFARSDIHFVAACVPGAQNRLPAGTKKLFGEILPSEPGMVRISKIPPNGLPQTSLPFESRFVDVPAAVLHPTATECLPDSEKPTPLIVPLNMSYAGSGPGVVSTRTMFKVDYNGYEFRKNDGCPELRSEDSIVKEAWPPGLVLAHSGGESSEPVTCSEGQKCAPENWILRRPVSHFITAQEQPVARYPPRNMLNAKYRRGTRHLEDWIPFATYREPSIPLSFWDERKSTSAFPALRKFKNEHCEIEEVINVLDLLRTVYHGMGYRRQVSDPWLQKSATSASCAAVTKFQDHVLLFNEREHGRPRPPKTIRGLFKADQNIKRKVAEIRSAASHESEANINKRLFEEASFTPGTLDRYEYEVERDMERYASELKEFQEVEQRRLDEERVLAAIDPSE